MKKPSSVAIYARISQDHDGLAEGVKRQVDDCRKLCADLGWVVGHVWMFLTGVLLSWFTLHPPHTQIIAKKAPSASTVAMAAKIRKNVKQKAKTVRL